VPTTSVICAAYNGASFLPQTLASLKAQTYTDFEAVFVDDASTDTTAAVLAQVADPRFVIATNDRNQRINYSRNRAISLARGRYIAVTDQDDLSDASRLERQVAFLTAHPAASAVYTYIRSIDASGRPLGTSVNWDYGGQQARAALMFHNFVTHSTLMFRRECVTEPVYVSDYPLCEDYWLLVRLADSGSGIHPLKRALVGYRTHATNHTKVAQDEMAMYSRTLRQVLLGRLGFTPSEHEMRLHSCFESGPFETTPALFRQCGDWLAHLSDSNRRAGYVPPQAFSAVVADKWLELAHKFSGLGREAWKIYSGGPSRGLDRKHLLSLASLWVKCAGIGPGLLRKGAGEG
jgi:glycosyltransferase involved in cell wall biosynthesis